MKGFSPLNTSTLASELEKVNLEQSVPTPLLDHTSPTGNPALGTDGPVETQSTHDMETDPGQAEKLLTLSEAVQAMVQQAIEPTPSTSQNPEPMEIVPPVSQEEQQSQSVLDRMYSESGGRDHPSNH